MKALMLLCSLVTAIPAATLKAKVVGIKSGADLEILAGGKVVALKIEGIDCADKTHASGKAARRFVAENAFLSEVAVEITGTGSDGSLVGKLTLPDGRDLAVELTKAGLAWRDKRNHPRDTGLARLEREARASGLGIWNEAADDEDEEDVGKEVLVQREFAGKNVDALLTQAGN